MFTPNLERHLHAPPVNVEGETVRAVLDAVFERNPKLHGYLLDDQGGLRQHVQVFVDGERIGDRRGLSDRVSRDAELYVMQALTGG